MFKIFTRKDKKKGLEKEINELLTVMHSMKPKADEDNRTSLEKEIDALLERLAQTKQDSDEYFILSDNLERLFRARAYDTSRVEEYTELAESLEKLYKARSYQKAASQIPWKEIAVGTFALVQILAIIKHEEVNVITSKALGWVTKGRV